MTSGGLRAVLESGREGRKAYYSERVYEFPEEERRALAKAFIDVPLGGNRTRHEILSSLTQDFEPDKAEDLFDRAWDKGLLDTRKGRYVIPIPSMQDWLISDYVQEQIKFPHSDLARQRNSDVDLDGR